MSEEQEKPVEPTEEDKQAVKHYFDCLFAGFCPTCAAKVERREQRGRCVYAVPCGHRLYQGEVKLEDGR